MSKIGAIPRDMERVALRAARRNAEAVTGVQANANLSKRSAIRTSGLQTADLGRVRLINQTRSIGHPLGSMPVRIDIQPDNDAKVFVDRTTDKLIWITSDKDTNVRIRVFL